MLNDILTGKALPPCCTPYDFNGASHDALLDMLRQPGFDADQFLEYLIVLIEQNGISHNQRQLITRAAHRAMGIEL